VECLESRLNSVVIGIPAHDKGCVSDRRRCSQANAAEARSGFSSGPLNPCASTVKVGLAKTRPIADIAETPAVPDLWETA